MAGRAEPLPAGAVAQRQLRESRLDRHEQGSQAGADRASAVSLCARPLRRALGCRSSIRRAKSRHLGRGPFRPFWVAARVRSGLSPGCHDRRDKRLDGSRSAKGGFVAGAFVARSPVPHTQGRSSGTRRGTSVRCGIAPNQAARQSHRPKPLMSGSGPFRPEQGVSGGHVKPGVKVVLSTRSKTRVFAKATSGI